MVNVSSIGHWSIKDAGELDLKGGLKFQLGRSIRTLEIYIATKLMNVLFTLELHRRLKGTGNLHKTHHRFFPQGVVGGLLHLVMIPNLN